ncbi:hypothetical protein HMPREF0765_4513 [Sphingobacterium spiritivorum ATCC 33300]|uniref:Uncharacterized protein n=1 Tax=Sphingobacterium spiritivorum ATCC 33300 TaxID=525372 RepID=C2G4K7_SPHSI|nr:hypothetical protein HMPREF0765_4513 [Sphingobacterium spiritivorum ATCC 33300]
MDCIVLLFGQLLRRQLKIRNEVAKLLFSNIPVSPEQDAVSGADNLFSCKLLFH